MSHLRVLMLLIASVAGSSLARGEEKHLLHSFKKIQLSDQFFSEGANYGDFNHDGVMDVVSGPYWYAGPDFTERHEYYPAKAFDIAGYSENFFTFTYDVNGDGWDDIIVVGFPGKETWWFENPHGKTEQWPRHVILASTDNESPTFTDLTRDGRPGLVCMSGGQIGYAEIPKDDPMQPWKFVPISPKRDHYQRFTHGLGVGDVNGDGRMDILEKDGWWEQPPAIGAGLPTPPVERPKVSASEPAGDLRSEQSEGSGDPRTTGETWQFHPFQFSQPGGSQMFAVDLNGDHRNDVITSKAAHAYGLAWFENISDEKNGVTFREHPIMGQKPEENEYGVAFSQLHAVAVADMDGDGIPDIITGKRFWAHAEHDPGSLEPAVLYWFQTVREKDGRVRFVPHQIDNNSGVGTQVVVGDLNGDKWPDIVVGNKKGTFVFIHEVKEVDRKTWDAAQPRKREGETGQAEERETSSKRAGASSTPAGAADRPARQSESPALPLSPSPSSAVPQAQAKSPKVWSPADGIPATAEDGHRLNLDFETGDLRDWKRVGTAFGGQPIKGDTVHARRADDTSGHAGEYWIGTYEIEGDGLQGTLTSVPFTVTHPWATFLVGGGAHELTRLEIHRADTDEMIFQAHGLDKEEMRPVAVNLRPHMGKEIYLRVVDQVGTSWGHINFDHFRFHDEEPNVPPAPKVAMRPDQYPFAGQPAEEAAKNMKLPPGFSVSVCAAEPDVKQPIAIAMDDRGRVWIAEAYEYPQRASGDKGRDRILIFEDTKGDGHFDKRTVFYEGLNLVSGLEVGFGGVWVGAAPYLMFIPDRNGDDVPDGPPEILLDGWHYEDTHETLNSFTWGPDGWLYGCHGVFTHSLVGKPGTPDSERVPLNAAIWRYHPTRHTFEVFAHGTSNPWGVDFDEYGQAFCTACVIPHLFHVIQGGRYHRQAGQHFNPYTYDDIKTIADHLHYLGKTPHEGNNQSDDAGGGHAHCGAMIYLGDAWPDEYRGKIFMNNIHGQRVNMDILKPSGSGYVGSHGPDFLLTQDRASQMLNFRYGPDGNVYVIDWYDMQACHDPNPAVVDRSNGRIYKINYGEPKHVAVDLKTKTDDELIAMLDEKNDYFVRHARRILQERAAEGTLEAAVLNRLGQMAVAHPQPNVQLRSLWALHSIGGLTWGALPLLGNQNEYVRAWTVQLALDSDKPNLEDLYPQLIKMAKSDQSPIVRLYLASALQRLPLAARWQILDGLVHHHDAKDHNLPLMYWYAAEPLAEADPDRALALGLSCGKTIPLIRDFMLHRIGSLKDNAGLAPLVHALGHSNEDDERLTILRGIRAALAGQRQVDPPTEWKSVSSKLVESTNDDVRREASALGVTFGDESALEAMRKLVSSHDADAKSRREALHTLLAAKDGKLAATLLRLLNEPALREPALAGLAQYDDPQTPTKLLAIYSTLSPNEKRSALATLSARPKYGRELVRAVAEKQIPPADLPADLVRQLHNLKDEGIDKALGEIWGQVRSTPEDKVKLIAHYRELVDAKPKKRPDPELGRAVFAKTCQQCHALYAVGAKIGPDLTGSNRADLAYLLSNVVDPSALIAKEYQASVITTSDGRTITGIVAAEDDKSVTVRTATETVILPKNEIDDRVLSEVSMMPEDQLKQFSDYEIISLVAYLRGKEQVPMLATKDNAATLFNGHDLTGWTGDEQLWSVEDGEIVGRSPGVPHNTFLVSDLSAANFRLSLHVKLVNDVGNSGVQFRSRPLDGYHEMRGYQADIGPGWWGKLYEENGRGVLSDKSGEPYLKKGDWNRYEIEADGSHIRTWLNGEPCVDVIDPSPPGEHQGIFALQIHSGPAMEVRFRNLNLEVK